MSESQNTPIGPVGVAVLAIVVGVVANYSRNGGYLCMFLTMVVGGVLGYKKWQVEGSWRSIAASLLAIGVIVSAGGYGLAMNAVKAEILESEKDGRRWEAQQAADERTNNDRAIVEREQERADRIRTELARPLSKRAREAEKRIENAPDITAKAHAICYADHLLKSAEATPEIKSLRKMRERVAKAIKGQYKADLMARRVLICRDGAFSDCECRGSHRGCCSSHGGVARCEPTPEVELVCDPREVDDLIEFHLEAVGRPLPPHLGRTPTRESQRNRGRWHVSPLRAVN